VKKSRVIIITIVITLLVVFGVSLAFKAGSGKSDNATVVQIEEAEYGELIEIVSAPGEIEPKTNVEISARISARIVDLPYKEGDIVTCGDPNANPPVPASVLIRLDARDMESLLRSAEAYRDAKAAAVEVERA